MGEEISMKTILYMATSITGKTTSGNDDTSWVQETDVERFDTEMTRCGAMVMGKTTYESFGDDLPLGKALLVVMTHDKDLLARNQEGLLFTDSSPKEVLNMLEDKGYQEVMLAGGESLNSAFLSENLVDEIRVIIKPIIIGQGKSLFNVSKDVNLKLLNNTLLDNGSIELSYELLTS
jgi:dihydrofolate reductase